MRQRNPDISFSAYVGTEEEARRTKAAPVKTASVRRSAGAAEPVRRSASRVWVLLLLLLASASVLVVRNAEQIRATINRPVVSIRMETPLHRVSEMDVRSVLAQYTGAGFFGMDVKALQRALEANPWIEQAIIRRVWPDTLAVAIHEEVPIARWGEKQLLNQYGAIFEAGTVSVGQSLPLLKGPQDSQAEMMAQYQGFTQMLLTTGLRIRELKLSDRGSWSLVLDNGVSLQVGREQLLERLQRFIAFYDRELHERFDRVSSIDLRYRNGIAVSMKSDLPTGVAAT